MKALLIDDSAQARRLLRLMLLEYGPGIAVIGEASNADEGLELTEKLNPDVLFLDIEMPGKSGLQFAQILQKKGIACPIIFTTAYNSYAINAFRLSALDYLLKPIQEDQLIEAIDKLKEQHEIAENLNRLRVLSDNLHEPNSTLCIPVQGGSEYFPIQEILYLEADGSYVRVKFVNGKEKVVSKNLKYFEFSLGESSFFVRCHRSYLVNMQHLAFHSKSNGGWLKLKNGSEIPISRERKQAVLSFLETLNR